jgi:predicted aconitase with swiveling domain
VNLAWGIVDVRDVAKAHVAAITNARAQGRYIATSDTLSFLGIVDAVRHKVWDWFGLVLVGWLGFVGGRGGVMGGCAWGKWVGCPGGKGLRMVFIGWSFGQVVWSDMA